MTRYGLSMTLRDAVPGAPLPEASTVTSLRQRNRAAALQVILRERETTRAEVARRCGLSKEKLTRGFRELYQCSVAEAVSERRLQRARQLLAQSDLSISSIGYRCGYMSNASFTRAFARRFGVVPTEMRRREMTA